MDELLEVESSPVDETSSSAEEPLDLSSVEGPLLVEAGPVEPEAVESLPVELEPDAAESLPVESESVEPPAAEDEGLAPAGSPVLAESEAEEPPPPEDEDESDEAPPVDEGTAGAGSTTVKAAVAGDDTASWPRPVGVRVHEAAPSAASAATVSVIDGPLTAPATRVTAEADALTPAEHSTAR